MLVLSSISWRLCNTDFSRLRSCINHFTLSNLSSSLLWLWPTSLIWKGSTCWWNTFSKLRVCYDFFLFRNRTSCHPTRLSVECDISVNDLMYLLVVSWALTSEEIGVTIATSVCPCLLFRALHWVLPSLSAFLPVCLCLFLCLSHGVSLRFHSFMLFFLSACVSSTILFVGKLTLTSATHTSDIDNWSRARINSAN
jgi:hypothetical protein